MIVLKILAAPVIAEWLVDKLHSAKFALRDFITG